MPLEITGPFIDTHPYRDRWLPWMRPAVDKLQNFCNNARWLDILDLWLEMEDLLGYPYGQVSLSNCLK